ncbi:MAG: lipopolysaccharide biosynthesis protein [Muribaculaceae bacterium]|nr:lipopolysaccharide biosynthesis protein [Muribaculaceae bacterium]
MIETFLYKLNSGKNSKLKYFLSNYLQLLIPNSLYRIRRKYVINKCKKREDWEYIKSRVDYYNKLSEKSTLPESSQKIKEHKIGKQKVYFFDSFCYIRWFNKELKWSFLPGDIIHVPEVPTIVKSRPLVENNQNSIILKLDKVRHFIFVNDKKQFSEKKDIAIFRGKVAGKDNRILFMNKFADNPMFDVGDVSKQITNPKWKSGKKTIADHLDYKFIMALEGNDVASNLKWVMSSNSIAVMPRPTCETWFMEGKLIPNYHYIEVKDDFSDLEERLRYYIEHQDEAEKIIENAHNYIKAFKDKKREKLISLLVLDKYFKLTNE